ncbi:MAG: hypothetical protein Q4F30_05210, partial [Akkermansia sp.]|nr:hypothetical protein [Akkermansia sp.]
CLAHRAIYYNRDKLYVKVNKAADVCLQIKHDLSHLSGVRLCHPFQVSPKLLCLHQLPAAPTGIYIPKWNTGQEDSLIFVRFFYQDVEIL